MQAFVSPCFTIKERLAILDLEPIDPHSRKERTTYVHQWITQTLVPAADFL